MNNLIKKRCMHPLNAESGAMLPFRKTSMASRFNEKRDLQQIAAKITKSRAMNGRREMTLCNCVKGQAS
jgi:hypothetical protein